MCVVCSCVVLTGNHNSDVSLSENVNHVDNYNEPTAHTHTTHTHRARGAVRCSHCVLCVPFVVLRTPPHFCSQFLWQNGTVVFIVRKMNHTYPTAHPGPTPHAPLEPLTHSTMYSATQHSHPAPPERTGSGSAHAAKPLAVLALSLLRLARPRTASVVRSPLRPAPVVLVALVRGASSSSSSSSSPPPPSSCSAAAARATAPVACRGAARAALRRAREAALHELG